MTRLNLGCGDKKFEGFVNIDIRPDVNPDICMNIADLSRFGEKTIDYILVHDALEHFPHRKVWAVLKEWVRVLRVGGRIEIQVPSIDRIYKDRNKLINKYGGDSSLRFSQLLFGGQTYRANFHYVCFTLEFFKLIETKLGMRIVQYFPEVGLYNHKVILERVK